MRAGTIRIESEEEMPKGCAKFCDILDDVIKSANKEREKVFPLEMDIYRYKNMPNKIMEKK